MGFYCFPGFICDAFQEIIIWIRRAFLQFEYDVFCMSIHCFCKKTGFIDFLHKFIDNAFAFFAFVFRNFCCNCFTVVVHTFDFKHKSILVVFNLYFRIYA